MNMFHVVLHLPHPPREHSVPEAQREADALGWFLWLTTGGSSRCVRVSNDPREVCMWANEWREIPQMLAEMAAQVQRLTCRSDWHCEVQRALRELTYQSITQLSGRGTQQVRDTARQMLADGEEVAT